MNFAFKIVLSLLAVAPYLQAQVPKKIIVEHFTNTVCGICASRNPAFYDNLAAQTEVLHIAIHPSSPYSSCQLNQHNPIENDARTNYYGVYGGTPRLVIQGNVISTSTNYGNSALFMPYQNQVSPASLQPHLSLVGSDSIQVSTCIKTEAAHSLGDLRLFVALSEDTLWYSSPNGETQHYHVFRRALSNPHGAPLSLPNNIGDSVVYTATVALHPTWDVSRLRAIAILQTADTREVIQAEQSTNANSPVATTLANIAEMLVSVNPNPAHNQLTFSLPDHSPPTTAELYDATGRRCATYALQQSGTILLPPLSPGIYWVQIRQGQAIKTSKVFIY